MANIKNRLHNKWPPDHVSLFKYSNKAYFTLSIDKIPERNISNNPYYPWLEFFIRYRELIVITINNLKLLWEEFWKVWNGGDKTKRKNRY